MSRDLSERSPGRSGAIPHLGPYVTGETPSGTGETIVAAVPGVKPPDRLAPACKTASAAPTTEGVHLMTTTAPIEVVR